ncbi:MAG: type II toxin-antitoxin system VapB family antitoxin [Bdellovibrionota bacterium]
MTKKIKKISTNIPEQLLNKACKLTQLNQTEALIAGLKELIAHHERQAIVDLKGKINIDIDLNEVRQRVHL